KGEKMKENIKKITSFAGIIPAAVVAVCAGVSICTYTAPKYEKILAAEQIENTKNTESTEKKSQKSVKKEENIPSVKTISEKAVYKDGVYIGTGTGFGGELKVQVTIKDGKITDIKLLSSNDDAPYISKAQALLKNIISGQTTDVDTVSGATYSSVGLINAVRDALSQAGGTEEKIETKTPKKSSPVSEAVNLSSIDEPSSYKDGVYTGSAQGYGGITTVEVTISNGQIVDIKILSHHDDSPYINNASSLIDAIINAQSTNVDAVSGATYSSSGIINAVRDALSKAGGKDEENLPEITLPAVSTAATTKRTRVNLTEIPEDIANLPEYKYADGTFEGTGEGYKGDVTVSVTISEHKIKSVNIVKNSDDKEYFSKASALCDSIVKMQSTDIDTVSGATYSSYGILDAVSDALSKSYSKAVEEQGKTTVPTTSVTTTTTTKIPETTSSEDVKLINGIFYGSAFCSPDESEDFEEYELSVKLTFENGVITDISEIAGVGDDYDTSNDWYVEKAANGTSRKKGVVSQILSKQKTDDIDTVSGATCSSNAIIKAVENALKTAEESIEK
ncbi:MAG: FMN-binding protein, partial [Oscillospiraceae bacterium]|nr:FMN-binding protein [Oscillospiraceae bacterium]